MGGFIIHQKPVRISPSNTEHVYTIESYNANDPAYPDYRYVFDIYIFPYKFALREKKARIKVRPNSEGFAIIDIKDIIKNFVKSNIRLEYDDMAANGITPLGYFGSLNYSSSVNNIPMSQNGAWNYTCANAMNQADNATNGFEDRFNIVDYRLIIGEEYLDSDGNIVTNMSNQVWQYEDSIQSLPFNIGTWSAVNPSIEWNFAFGTPTGVIIEWYDSTETTLKGGTSSSAGSGTYETPTEPVSGDILYVESQYAGKKFKYIWVTDPENINPGWTFVELQFPDDNYWSPKFSPPVNIIWLATDNETQNDYYKSLLSVDDGIYTEDNIYANYNHLFDYTKFVFEVTGSPLDDEGYFLTNAHKRYYDSSIGKYVNERTIYRNQPFIIGFLNGHMHEFSNELRGISVRLENESSSGLYFAENQVNRGGGPLIDAFNDPYPSIFEPAKIGNKLQHLNLNILWTSQISADRDYMDVFGICDLANMTGNDKFDYNNANTQIYRYKIKENDCFNIPLSFVFLNSNGAWDSFTFGKKNQKVYEVNRSSYDKALGKDSTQFIRRAEDMKNVVFHTDIKVVVDAFTDYLDEYDSRIVEDLLRSPEVYVVLNNYPYEEQLKNTHMMPIKILTSEVEEYQKKYKRLFQHTIQFEYNSSKDYKSAI